MKLRRATLSDARHVAMNLRQSDVAEVEAFGRKTPRQSVMESFSGSLVCYAMLHQGRTVGLVGCADSAAEGVGICWLLATEEASKVSLGLTKVIPALLTAWQSLYYPLGLYNWTLSSNAMRIRWLRRVGFTIGDPNEHNAFTPFHWNH